MRHYEDIRSIIRLWKVWMRGFWSMIAWELIVAPFFFFSGWGIMSSLQKKGKVYVRQLVLSRFPGLWVKFAIAVLLFAMLQWLLGVEYPWQQVLISLIGWVSVGNSNWFVFMTLLLYLMVAVVFFTPPSQKTWLGIGAMVLLVGATVYIFSMLKPPYWYNTLLCFPAGMVWLLLCKKLNDNVLRWGGAMLAGMSASWLVAAHAWWRHSKRCSSAYGLVRQYAG